MVKMVYFAWVRERIGVEHEEIELPADVATAHDLLTWLAKRDEGHAAALAEPNAVRVAADKQLIGPHDPLGDASEIAIFPPMTGG